MPNNELPENELKEMILRSLRPGFYLESLDITVGTLIEGQNPAFTVLIRLSEDPDAHGIGLGQEIAQRIRERWSRDDLYIKIESSERRGA